MKQGASGRDHGELFCQLFTATGAAGIRVIDQACPQKTLRFMTSACPAIVIQSPHKLFLVDAAFAGHIPPLLVPQSRQSINDKRGTNPQSMCGPQIAFWLGTKHFNPAAQSPQLLKERRGAPQTPSNAAASLLGAPRRRGRTWAGGQLSVWPVFALRESAQQN